MTVTCNERWTELTPGGTKIPVVCGHSLPCPEHPMSHQPELSSSQEERLHDLMGYAGQHWPVMLNKYGATPKDLQTFIAKEIDNAVHHRETEIKGKIELLLSGRKIDNGHDCYEKWCEYCDDMVKDQVLLGLLELLDSSENQKNI